MPPHPRGEPVEFRACGRLSAMLPALGVDPLTPLTTVCTYERSQGCRLTDGSPYGAERVAILYPGPVAPVIWALSASRQHQREDERAVEAVASVLVTTRDPWSRENTLRAARANRSASISEALPPPTLDGARARDRSGTRWAALSLPTTARWTEELIASHFLAPDSYGFEPHEMLAFYRADEGWLMDGPAWHVDAGMAVNACGVTTTMPLDVALALVQSECPAQAPAAQAFIDPCGEFEYHHSVDCHASRGASMLDVIRHTWSHFISGGTRLSFDVETCQVQVFSSLDADPGRLVTWASSRRADVPDEVNALSPWFAEAEGQRFASAPALSSRDRSRDRFIDVPAATLKEPWRFAHSLPPPRECSSAIRVDNIRVTLSPEFDGEPVDMPATRYTIRLGTDAARTLRRAPLGPTRPVGIPMQSVGAMFVQDGGILLPLARHGHHVFFEDDHATGTTLAIHDTSRDRSRLLLHLADAPSDVRPSLLHFDGSLLIVWFDADASWASLPGLLYAVDLSAERGAILHPLPAHGQAPTVSAEGLEFVYDTEQGDRCTTRVPIDQLQRMLAD